MIPRIDCIVQVSRRLWTLQIRRNSLRMASRPRRENLRSPRVAEVPSYPAMEPTGSSGCYRITKPGEMDLLGRVLDRLGSAYRPALIKLSHVR